MSPPPNWSRNGEAARDLVLRHARAPQSASEVHGQQSQAAHPGIGHPLSLRFNTVPWRCASAMKSRQKLPPPKAYGTCRSYGKAPAGLSHSSLDGRPTGAAHRSHRPGDEPKGKTLARLVTERLQRRNNIRITR